jgi:uncharacterized HAD superfamily protein
MARLKIGVDIDGVLANFVGQARADLQTILGDGRPADDLIQTSWNFTSLGITKQEENQLWRYIDEFRNWWLQLERMPNTNYLRHLCDNARVIFITNRKDGNKNWGSLPIEDQSRKWLERRFHIPHPTVLISDNKGPLVAGLGLDYFIDDRPKNVEEVVAASPATVTYLLDATYNKECQVQRVATFDDFARMVLPLEVINQPNYGTLERCAI